MVVPLCTPSTIFHRFNSMVVGTSIAPGGGVASATGTPLQTYSLPESTNSTLLKIIRTNLCTQYATQAPSLSGFRDAISVHDGTKDDASLLAAFRAHVPLSDYNCYKPFVDRFSNEPIKLEDIENLLAPGLPEFLVPSSSTTGMAPKMIPKYSHGPGSMLVRFPFLESNDGRPVAAMAYCGCMSMKNIECAPGLVVQKIPVLSFTGALVRKYYGWESDDDQKRLSLSIPYYAAPWAATTLGHLPSFFIIHGLFFLTHKNIGHFYVTFAPLFLDLIYHIDEQWDILLSCIRDGVLPDLESIGDVREYLQAQFRADPDRAAELGDIGPPSSVDGWAHRVWPQATMLWTACSGQFSTVLPKLKSVLGPAIPVRCTRYGSTEAVIGSLRDWNNTEEFVLLGDEVIEFLDVSQGESSENIRQAWEVEVGRQYEPILTTRDGLWRYQIGDIVSIAGFMPESKIPILTLAGRKSLKIRLPHAQIRDFSLLEAIRAVNSEDTIRVQEFTTLLDDRAFPPTVGFFVELTGSVGPNAHLAPQKLFDALVATDVGHQRALQLGQMRLPTIRIVKPGTFTAFRNLSRQVAKMNSGQIKVPLVLVNPATQEWVLGRVVQEL